MVLLCAQGMRDDLDRIHCQRCLLREKIIMSKKLSKRTYLGWLLDRIDEYKLLPVSRLGSDLNHHVELANHYQSMINVFEPVSTQHCKPSIPQRPNKSIVILRF